jgi:small GTP-binding protein
MSESVLRVALAGQPNAGKSTLFNALTGARQHVANYPGVTVDKKYGQYRDAQGEVQTVDLPGTYSLSSFSLEERVAREFLITEAPDLVLNVVDAANLQRSLRLTLQLLEMERPLLLALNMMDVAQRRGILIDVPELASRLGVAVVPTVGRRGEGRDDLRQALTTACWKPISLHWPILLHSSRRWPICRRAGWPCSCWKMIARSRPGWRHVCRLRMPKHWKTMPRGGARPFCVCMAAAQPITLPPAATARSVPCSTAW